MLDPGLGLSSAQCVGFDYWATMYNRYRVIGAKCQLKVALAGTSTAGASGASATVVMWPATESGALASISDASSQPYAITIDVTSQSPKTITQIMKTSTISGIKVMEGSDSLQALISAGPGDQWFFNIGEISGAAYTNVAIEKEIILTYDVEFFDRALINRSSLTAKYVRLAYIERCKEQLAAIEAERKRKEENKNRLPLPLEAEQELKRIVPLSTNVTEEDDDWAPVEILKAKAKEAQRKLALAENDQKSETASRKGK